MLIPEDVNETWWNYTLYNTDGRSKIICLSLKVSRVPRCCLWTNRLAPNRVLLTSAYISYFCFIKQIHFASETRKRVFLMQQNLFSLGQNEQGIYFMPGRQELSWLKCRQNHPSSLKSETKTRQKSIKRIKAALQQSLACTLCAVLRSEKQHILIPEMTN